MEHIPGIFWHVSMTRRATTMDCGRSYQCHCARMFLPSLLDRGNTASVLRIVPYAAIHFGEFACAQRCITPAKHAALAECSACSSAVVKQCSTLRTVCCMQVVASALGCRLLCKQRLLCIAGHEMSVASGAGSAAAPVCWQTMHILYVFDFTCF